MFYRTLYREGFLDLSPREIKLESDKVKLELKEYYSSIKEKNNRKETIKTFFKPKDLDYYNLTKKTSSNSGSLTKNVTIQEIFMSKKKAEHFFKSTKNKGTHINELWSEDYYKKVMKTAHLQEIIDDIKENQRKRNLKKKQELLKKSKETEKIEKYRMGETLRLSTEMKSPMRRIKNLSNTDLPQLINSNSFRENEKQERKNFIKEKKLKIQNLIDFCYNLNEQNKEIKESIVGEQNHKIKIKKNKKIDALNKRKLENITSSVANFMEKKNKRKSTIVLFKENT